MGLLSTRDIMISLQFTRMVLIAALISMAAAKYICGILPGCCSDPEPVWNSWVSNKCKNCHDVLGPYRQLAERHEITYDTVAAKWQVSGEELYTCLEHYYDLTKIWRPVKGSCVIWSKVYDMNHPYHRSVQRCGESDCTSWLHHEEENDYDKMLTLPVPVDKFTTQEYVCKKCQGK